MPSTPARVYSDRYELTRRIARGGMAEVYLARDLLLDRPVALKMLFPELSVDRAFVERFRREAQSAANLSHPYIVSVYDWGEGDGSYFIVMEFVDGHPLSTVIRSEGALLPDRAAAIGTDVADALTFAHRHGVIHRDIKPGNILITGDGHVKVTDFGIARAASTRENLTQTGTVMGTATYFSPEQAQGEGVDARSDVYSLGVVLYEMVTGRPPFTGDNPVAIAYKHVREEPIPPRGVNSAVPVAFESIVLQAIAKDAADRYASAEDLGADLTRFRQGRPVLAWPPLPGGAATQAMGATAVAPAVGGSATQLLPSAPASAGSAPAPATAGVERRPPRRGSGTYVGLLFAMLALLVALLYLLGRTLGVFASSGSSAVVQNVVGEPVDQATQVLTGEGFKVTPQYENNDASPNTVFAQDPQGGTSKRRGSTVTVRVSQGQIMVRVPSAVGKTLRDATSALQAAGFQVSTSSQNDDRAPKDTVLGQTPQEGTNAAKGSTVRLVVSSGKNQVPVPDVAGETQTDAANALGQAGMSVGTVTRQPSSTVAKDAVISTNPPARTQVDKGSSVDLVVSSGPAQAVVPNVIGLTEGDARTRLADAGFKVSAQSQTDPNPSDNGRVIDQSPSGGTQAPTGSTVSITVARGPTATTSSRPTTSLG